MTIASSGASHSEAGLGHVFQAGARRNYFLTAVPLLLQILWVSVDTEPVIVSTVVPVSSKTSVRRLVPIWPLKAIPVRVIVSPTFGAGAPIRTVPVQVFIC